MSKDLERKSQELELTLAKQLQLLQKDSKDWLKVGGVVMVAGLVTYGLIQATKKKKEDKMQLTLDVLAKEGLLTKEIEAKLIKPSKSNFWYTLTQKLVLTGLIIAKEKFLSDLLLPSLDQADAPEKKA